MRACRQNVGAGSIELDLFSGIHDIRGHLGPWVVLYVSSALLVLIGSLLQSIIGFGMGVLTIPIFVWLGVSLETAVGLLIPSVLVQTSFNCWQNRGLLPWKDVWTPYALRLTFLPVGIWVLSTINSSETLGRQVLAVTVVAMIVTQMLIRRAGRTRDIASWWVIPAATTSGFMAGLIGMGGPSLVLWVAHQPWRTQRQRAFLWLSFLLIVPFQGALMGLRFGIPMWCTFLFGALLVPFVVAGAWIGNKIGNRLTPERLRLLMYLFLIVISTRLLTSK